MRTNINTTLDIKSLYLEMLLNKTDKVTKIADHSVLNAHSYGIAKIHQKAMKDSALVESELFPDLAFGSDLDLISLRYGLSQRYMAIGSSVPILLVADFGTKYDKDFNILMTGDGRRFQLSQDITIGRECYAYVIANSLQVGETANIGPGEILKMLNPPMGHRFVTNESMGVGGRTIETDSTFRNRISEGFNYLATDTLSRLQQIFILLNPNVLDLRKIGRDSKGNVLLAIVTQNGIELTSEELDLLLEESRKFLSITDVKIYTNELTGLILSNVKYTYIDIDFSVDLNQNADVSNFALRVQIEFLKYFDWRFWDENKKVEWDDLFFIVKSQSEVRYIPDNLFYPSSDIVIQKTTLPRLRGFKIRSLNGNILFDNADILSSEPNPNAIFYQSHLSENYANAVLSNI